MVRLNPWWIDKAPFWNANWYSKLNASGISIVVTSSHSELLTDAVYARLRDMIVTNALHTGQKLVDRELAQLLGVSRTPVREALGRLAMTGLVENRARRGYYVSIFSVDQVSDLYEFRKMLEVNAARLAAQNAQPVHLREFDHILDQVAKLTSEPKEHARAVKLDLEIHELIARASGLKSLHQAVQGALDKVMRFISVEIGNKESLAAAHSQHQALLRAIKKRDADRAAELIRAHIEGAQESLLEVIKARDSLRNAVLSAGPSRKDARSRVRSSQKSQKEERHARY